MELIEVQTGSYFGEDDITGTMIYMGEIKNLSIDNIKIAVIGLGYVGLPLAIEFAKKFPTIGFDIDKKSIKKLKEGLDSTQEISKESLKGTKLIFTKLIGLRTVTFIITVPTPADSSKIPDLIPIKSATALVSSILKKGDIVVYESTVFPGLTEEICVPILETSSNLKYNEDSFVVIVQKGLILVIKVIG